MKATVRVRGDPMDQKDPTKPAELVPEVHSTVDVNLIESAVGLIEAEVSTIDRKVEVITEQNIEMDPNIGAADLIDPKARTAVHPMIQYGHVLKKKVSHLRSNHNLSLKR